MTNSNGGLLGETGSLMLCQERVCNQKKKPNKVLWWIRNSFLVGGVLFEVSDNVSTVLGVGDTSEGHSVSGGIVSRGFQVLVEGTVSPGLVTETLEGTGVGESFLLGGEGAVCVLEQGASAMSTHTVADSAE